jgi:transposase-like protein
MKKNERKIVKYVKKQTAAIDAGRMSREEQLEILPDSFKERLETFKSEFKTLELENIQLGKYEILKHKLIHLYLSGNYNVREMASILGMSESTIKNWLHRPEVKEVIEQYQLEEDMVVNATMKGLRLKAVDKQRELLNADNEMVQAVVARDILQMTGHKAPDKKTVDVNVTYEQKLTQLMKKLSNKEVKAEYAIDGESAKINTEGEV